jgi:group I intron endonuclease
MTASSILQPTARRGFLYRISFPNGKVYIGITSRTVKERFAEHCGKAARLDKNFAVHAAICKYGKENILLETIASANWDEIKAMEVSAIAEQNARVPFGYNLTDGGDGTTGIIVGKETRAMMRANNIGKKLSAETKAKIGAAHEGRIFTEESRAKLSSSASSRVFSESDRAKNSEIVRALWADPAYRKKVVAAHAGKKLSETHKAKILARANDPESRALRQAEGKARWADPEYRARMMLALNKKKKPV